jgi:hypothetical protein
VAAWPNLAAVRTFLRLQPDAAQDAVIGSALAAAVDYGVGRYNGRYDADALDVPDSGYQACLMHAARLFRRRDTVDGTINFGDAGGMRVGRIDPDIDALYAQHAPLVFG